MGCCGGKNRFLRPRTVESSTRDDDSGRPAPRVERESVWFEYTGPTALTALGPITNHRYRFTVPGARVAVDARDAASITGVPHLKRVRDV